MPASQRVCLYRDAAAPALANDPNSSEASSLYVIWPFFSMPRQARLYARWLLPRAYFLEFRQGKVRPAPASRPRGGPRPPACSQQKSRAALGGGRFSEGTRLDNKSDLSTRASLSIYTKWVISFYSKWVMYSQRVCFDTSLARGKWGMVGFGYPPFSAKVSVGYPRNDGSGRKLPSPRRPHLCSRRIPNHLCRRRDAQDKRSALLRCRHHPR